jgi:WD40 repeat protein
MGNYLASSSNEGCVKIWDIRTQQVLQKHHVHRSAVKALEWCPWKPSHLISGGGIHDRKICVYDATKFEIEHIIKHNYQITGLAFNKSTKQVMFSYGNLYRQRTNNHLPNQRHNVGNALFS